MATPPGTVDDGGPATEAWIYRLAMESLPDTVFVAGEDGTVEWVCSNVQGIFGRSAEEIVGETVSSLLGTQFATAWGDSEAVRSNRPANIIDTDGVDHSLLVTVKPLALDPKHLHGRGQRATVGSETHDADERDDPTTDSGDGDGERGTLLYACRDVTDLAESEMQLAESESRFREVFEGTLDALVLADDEGRYLDVNQAACELYGLSQSALIGKTAADFAPAEFDFEAVWDAFLDAGEARGEFELHRPDGKVRITDFAARANIRPGEHLSILRDVTARAERERQLREQRDELARLDHINRLVSVVNRALIGADTRHEVLSDVCTQLVDADVYCHALVATELASGRFEVTTAAGLSEQESAAIVEALHGELVMANRRQASVITPPPSQVKRHEGVTADVFGCFPLAYEGTVHGILLVGANRTDGVPALVGGEQHLLDDLGTTVGKAVTAVSARRLLHVDEVTKLEFTVGDDDVFNQLSRLIGATVSVTGLVPVRGGRHACYADVTDIEDEVDTDWLETQAEAIDAVEQCRVVSTTGTLSIELLIDDSSPALVLETQGAHIRTVVSSEGVGRLVAEIPLESNVRSLLTRIVEEYPQTELIRKVTDRASSGTVGVIGGRRPSEPLTSSETALTEKQLAALRAAYAGGYYDWPRRGSSAQELAEVLDIAPATYHQHLRAAQRKLVDSYFSP